MKAIIQDRFGPPDQLRLAGIDPPGIGPGESRVPGIDAAGRAEAAGTGVAGLRPGQDVLGFCRGAFAEYARTR